MAEAAPDPHLAPRPAAVRDEAPLPRLSVRLRLWYLLSGCLFWAGYGVLGLRRSVIRENLRRSFPDLSRAELGRLRREFIGRQAEIFAETMYGASLPRDELHARVRILDAALLEQAAAPRPLILATGHQCNFEWMLLRVSADLGPGLVALYKPLRNQWFEQRFRRLRTRFGAHLIAAKSVLRELARFREARAIGIVADQVPRTSPEKLWLQFLHQDTAFYMGPELLGRALRSQVAYVSMRRIARGVYEIEIQPLNEPGERLATGQVTERYARALERDIGRDPAGWWWSHKRWKLSRPQ
jgi:Kdo2-lipid IVA lauroyltransferase/acyltransferase